MGVKDVLTYIFETLPHEISMMQQHGPDWKDIEALQERAREEKMRQLDEQEEGDALKRDYMRAQMEYLEALRNKASRPEPPPSAREQWSESEARRKLQTQTPGTPEYADAEKETLEKLFRGHMDYAGQGVDPSGAFPEDFASLSAKQQSEITEEYEYAEKMRARRTAPEEPKTPESEKRWDQIVRGFAKPTVDPVSGELTFPDRGEVLANSFRVATAEGLEDEIPMEARLEMQLHATRERIGGEDATTAAAQAPPTAPLTGAPEMQPAPQPEPEGMPPQGQAPEGMEPSQFPEGAPKTQEEAAAQLATGDPQALNDTIEQMQHPEGKWVDQTTGQEQMGPIPMHLWKPEVLNGINDAVYKLRDSGVPLAEARERYPALLRAFDRMQQQMQQPQTQPQGGGV